MNWKIRFRELTGWRPKNDEERTKNDEERWRSFTKSLTEMSWKRYGNTSTWLFFMETIFLTNFERILKYQKGWTFCSTLFPLFVGEKREWLPPSSPRRAKLLTPEGTAFFWNPQEGPSGPGFYLHPLFTKYTPLCVFFVDSFPKHYETLRIM